MDELRSSLGRVRIEPVLIPHDCVDGFLGAFWRRPEAYVDATVRQAMSGFAQLPPEIVERGIARLAADLERGEWDRRFGPLRLETQVDLGYRLVVSGTPSPPRGGEGRVRGAIRMKKRKEQPRGKPAL
jgi:hypothetical protein